MSDKSFHPMGESFYANIETYMAREIQIYRNEAQRELEEIERIFGITISSSDHQECPTLKHIDTIDIPAKSFVEFRDDGLVLQDDLFTYTRDGFSKTSTKLPLIKKTRMFIPAGNGNKFVIKSSTITDRGHTYNVIHGKYVSILVVSDSGNFTAAKRQFFFVPNAFEFSDAFVVGEECWYAGKISSFIRPTPSDMFSSLSLHSMGVNNEVNWYHAGSCTRVLTPDDILHNTKIALREDGSLISKQGDKLKIYSLNGVKPRSYYKSKVLATLDYSGFASSSSSSSSPRSPPRSPRSPPRSSSLSSSSSSPRSPSKSKSPAPPMSPPRTKSSSSSSRPLSPRSPPRSKVSLPTFAEYMRENRIPKSVPDYSDVADEEVVSLDNGYIHFVGTGAILKQGSNNLVAWVDEDNGSNEILPLNAKVRTMLRRKLSDYSVNYNAVYIE